MLEPITPILGRFSGRSVLVTGAGSGIGAATAARFGAEGAAVLVTDIDGDAALDVAEGIRRAGGRADSRILDQSDEAAVAAFAASRDGLGLDIACINAGAVLPLNDIELTEPAAWDWINGVNLRGAYLVARAVTPLIRSRGGGAIVFTASITSFRGHPGSGAYATTKAGLLGLSRSLALELGVAGIRVNCVCPGPVLSRMGGTAEDLRAVLPTIPLGRVAEPEDVAAAICFLASADARHISATELVVDGGAIAEVPLPEPLRGGTRTLKARQSG